MLQFNESGLEKRDDLDSLIDLLPPPMTSMGKSVLNSCKTQGVVESWVASSEGMRPPINGEPRN